MSKREPETMTEDQRRALARQLRDKYIEKHGHGKKIIVDDCINQFVAHFHSQPSAADLRDLDNFVKKRCLGKEETYDSYAESSAATHKIATKQPGFGVGRNAPEKSAKVTASQASIKGREEGSKMTDAKGKNSKEGPIGRGKDDKGIQYEPPEVTGKITTMPAAKLKKKKGEVAKAEEKKAASVAPTARQLDEATMSKILDPVPLSGGNGIKPSLNKWGVLDVYRNQEYENEKSAKIQNKKAIAETYKKILDEQISQQQKVRKLDKMGDEATALKAQSQAPKQAAQNPKKRDEKSLYSEYDSLQKEMESSNLINPRGINLMTLEAQILKLQNELSWSNAKLGNSPGLTDAEKRNRINNYKDELEKQLQERNVTCL
jgi:hypothetical protein